MCMYVHVDIHTYMYMLVCMTRIYSVHIWILHICMYNVYIYMYIHMWKTHDMCIQTWILHIFHSLSLSIYVSLCLCIYLNTPLPKPHLQISYSCLFLCHYYPFEIHLYLDSFHFRIFFPLFLIFFFMSI